MKTKQKGHLGSRCEAAGASWSLSEEVSHWKPPSNVERGHSKAPVASWMRDTSRLQSDN